MTNARFLVVAVLLILGIAVSILFGSLGHPFASTAYRPLKVPLDQFPMSIDEWEGTDQELDSRVKDIAGMDHYLNRVYKSPAGERVNLYIAYYGNRQRGLRTIYHNPTICLPSAGWKEHGARRGVVELASGPRPEIDISLHGFDQRGREIVVLNFYIVDGKQLDGPPRNRPDELAVQKLSMSFDAGYYVQVQVVPIGTRRIEEGERTCIEFLEAAGSHIFRHF